MKELLPHLALIILLVGIVLWGIFRHAKDTWPAEVGRVMFAVGLLVYLLKGIR